MAHRIAVVGSNMTDLVTSIVRMPAPGETLEAPSFFDGIWRQGRQSGGGRCAPGRRSDDGHQGWRRCLSVRARSTTSGRMASTSPHIGTVSRANRAALRRSSSTSSGENSILIIKGANDELKPADIDAAAEDLKRCDLILMQLEVPLETVYYTIAFADRHGIETILNPAPAAPDLDAKQVTKATFLVPNETELALLTGMPTGTDSRDRVGSAVPDRQGHPHRHRHSWDRAARAWSRPLHRRSSNRSRSSRKTPPAPVMRSSAASPATTWRAANWRLRSKRRRSMLAIPLRARGRRSPMRQPRSLKSFVRRLDQ